MLMHKVAVNVSPKNSNLSSILIRFETLGCRLNQIESEAAAHFFSEAGFTVLMEGLTAKTPGDEDTLLYVINTCSVTQKAEQKARRIIRLILKTFPRSCVLVTGCYAQLRPEELLSIDSKIAVLQGQLKSRIEYAPKVLAQYLDANLTEFWDPSKFAVHLTNELKSLPVTKPGFPENSFRLATDSYIAHSRSSLKIQDGCNNNCSYCTINIARGHSVSLDVQTVLERVKQLEKIGQAEIVFTTVNIGQYRGEWKGGYLNFTELLKLCLEITSSIRFRISSLYPEVIDDDFCEVIKNPRVQPHFHISVQSGSNSVLRAMNRRYTRDEVVEACRRLRNVKEDPFIACDLITGFPGESPEDFDDTLNLCRECKFTWVHAFPYSVRPGTAAASLPHKVANDISDERAKKLTDYAASSKAEYINSCIGKEYFAVLELSRKPVLLKNSDICVYHAVTENFLHVEIKESKLKVDAAGTPVVKVCIDGAVGDLKKGGELEALGHIVW